MNDSELDKYDALLEAIEEVNEKRGETVFEKVEKDEQDYAETNAETNAAETNAAETTDPETSDLSEVENKTPAKPKKTKKITKK
jgi:hypothetical protein